MNTQKAIEVLKEIQEMYFHPCPDNVSHQKEALTHAIESMKRNVWQPIDTAPKDGTTIIVYRPKFDGKYIPKVGVDYWGKYKLKPMGCWMKSRTDVQPTHFILLPEPPQEGETK